MKGGLHHPKFTNSQNLASNLTISWSQHWIAGVITELDTSLPIWMGELERYATSSEFECIERFLSEFDLNPTSFNHIQFISPMVQHTLVPTEFYENGHGQNFHSLLNTLPIGTYLQKESINSANIEILFPQIIGLELALQLHFSNSSIKSATGILLGNAGSTPTLCIGQNLFHFFFKERQGFFSVTHDYSTPEDIAFKTINFLQQNGLEERVNYCFEGKTDVGLLQELSKFLLIEPSTLPQKLEVSLSIWPTISTTSYIPLFLACV